MKILLADGDSENLRFFRNFIRKAFPEIKQIGAVSDVDSFREELKKQHPDLIIGDFRFWGAVSYQILIELNEQYPDVRFILHGTFDDHEYAGRLVNYGLLDFIYKPVKATDLERCIRDAKKVIAELEREKSQMDDLIADYQSDISFFKDRFVTNLLNGCLMDEEIRSSLNYFNLSMRPNFSVFTIRIDHFKKIILTLTEMEKHLLSFQLQKICCGVAEKTGIAGNMIAHINSFNSLSVITGSSMNLAELISFADEIKVEAMRKLKVPITIGVGNSYKLLSEIGISRKESEAALMYRYYMGYNTIIPFSFVEPDNMISYRYPIEKEQTLVYAAVSGEYEYCLMLIKTIFDSLKESGKLPPGLIPKIITAIVISISRYVSEQGIDTGNTINTIFPSAEVFALKTPDEAFDYLSVSLRHFCDFMISQRDKNNDKIYESAKEYILENYYKNISVMKIAVYAKTTPEFLNNLFMKKERMSVFDYAVSVRLTHAKRLLIETELPDDIIALNVGYDDVRHFRSVFKLMEGLTTAEYKIKHTK